MPGIASDKVDFIQLDDLDYEQLKSLAPVSCLILETSPGNHQVWVAVSDLDKLEAKDFARRLRKGTGADATASGATRAAGTENYKRKYEPEFPTVKILQAAPGRLTTKSQLEALSLVAEPEPVYEAPASSSRVSSIGRSWPDYQRCVQGAPRSGDKKPDSSRADFFFSKLCAQRGHDIPEIASRLMELSSNADDEAVWAEAQRMLPFYQDRSLSAFIVEKVREYVKETVVMTSSQKNGYKKSPRRVYGPGFEPKTRSAAAEMPV